MIQIHWLFAALALVLSMLAGISLVLVLAAVIASGRSELPWERD